GLLPEELSEEERSWASRLILLYQEQLRYGAELPRLAALFFQEDVEYNQEIQAILSDEQVPDLLKTFLNLVQGLETFDTDEIKQAIKQVQKETGLKGKRL